MNAEMEQAFHTVIEKAKNCKTPMRVAVAGADVENVLQLSLIHI